MHLTLLYVIESPLIMVFGVKWEEGKALAESCKIQFFETSAKEDINVTDAFLNVDCCCTKLPVVSQDI